MKKITLIFLLLASTVFVYAQDYKMKDNTIVKVDNNGKVLQSKLYNKSVESLKDFSVSNTEKKIIVVAINYEDYSKIEILNSDLIYQDEVDINGSSNIKAIAINGKNEIVILFNNGDIRKYDLKLNKIE